MILYHILVYIYIKEADMDDSKKKEIKNAFIVFLKALIPPTIALISSILTTLVSGDNVAVGTSVGALTGYIANTVIG